MASELLGRQDKILRGPMWSGLPHDEVGKPLYAKANVACVNSRLVNQRIAENFLVSTKPEIQVSKIIMHVTTCCWSSMVHFFNYFIIFYFLNLVSSWKM